jgi:thioredoxin reductase (NADPH)
MTIEETKVVVVGAEQAPKSDPETMETDVPGLYVAGTTAAGTQERFTAFIPTSHDDVARDLVEGVGGGV